MCLIKTFKMTQKFGRFEDYLKSNVLFKNYNLRHLGEGPLMATIIENSPYKFSKSLLLLRAYLFLFFDKK